ncbi:hypothetical protein FF962_31610 [Pseudomonas aeruginosa]|nr:hypothetical protein FF962_31610 [Pseudomonas aeruginosa]
MNAVWPAGGGGHRRVSSPAARQENHGAAPTSCSGSKRRSLNSLKNCLDRWVHFIRLEEQVEGTSHFTQYKATRYTIRRSFTSEFDF